MAKFNAFYVEDMTNFYACMREKQGQVWCNCEWRQGQVYGVIVKKNSVMFYNANKGCYLSMAGIGFRIQSLALLVNFLYISFVSFMRKMTMFYTSEMNDNVYYYIYCWLGWAWFHKTSDVPNDKVYSMMVGSLLLMFQMHPQIIYVECMFRVMSRLVRCILKIGPFIFRVMSRLVRCI